MNLAESYPDTKVMPLNRLSSNFFPSKYLDSPLPSFLHTNKDYENKIRIVFGASQANVFLGNSPSKASESWRKMQDEEGLHMTAFARNAGMPIGQFIITANSIEDYKKLRGSLESKIAGAKNNGKVLFNYRPSDVKEAQIEWVQFTSQDVQDYTPSMEFADKKISKNFGVPGTIKGSNDGENYATASVSRQNFAEWTIEPLVSTVREQLEFQLAKKFELKGEIKSRRRHTRACRRESS